MKRTASKVVVSIVVATAAAVAVPSIAAAVTAAHGQHKVQLIDSLSIVRGKKGAPAAPPSSAPVTTSASAPAPSSTAPSTAAPSTAAPSTAAPSTAAPTTPAATSTAPTTTPPSSSAPASTTPPTSTAPASTAPASTAPPSSSAPASSAPPAATWLSGAWPGGSIDKTALAAFDAFRGHASEVATVYHVRDSWSTIGTNFWAEQQYSGWNGTLDIGMPLLPTCSGCGSLHDVAAGTYDSYFTSFAKGLVAMGRGSSIIRLAWEFDGGWQPWAANNATDFVNAFRHVVTLIRAQAPNVKIDWCGNYGGSQVAGGDEFTNLYPGDAYVDIVGVDAYDRQWHAVTDDTSWNSYVNGSHGLADWLAFAKAHGKKLSLPEWGLYSTETGDAPVYIQKMHDWFAAHAGDLAYEAYFNEPDSYIMNALSGPDQNPNSAALYAKLWTAQA